MDQLTTIEYRGQRVLTTQQLAESYETETGLILKNFERNKERYQAGTHYFKLEGEELKAFKASGQIDDNLKFAPHIYVWTEKGCLHHAKSLGTDKAWDVFNMLVDTYFRVKKMLDSEYQAIEKLFANPDNIIQICANWKEDREKRIEAENKNAMLMHVSKTYTTTEIAKELKMKSAAALNMDLLSKKIQFKQNGTWVLYSQYADKGYMELKQEILDNGAIIYNSRWTQLGREFLLNLYQAKAVSS